MANLTVLQRQPGLGEALGTGLGAGLQALASLKMQQLQQRQAAGGLQALGLPPQMAAGMVGLDPRIQQEVIKQQLQAPQQQAYAQALGQITGQPPAEGVPGEVPGIQPPAGLTQQQATELAKLQMQQRKEQQRERVLAFKETKEVRSSLLKESRTAREDDIRLDRMEELNKAGKLNAPAYTAILDKLGLDIPALLNPESQEFQKLSIDFLRNARNYFGARVTTFEAQTFLKSIPSLMQSKEGRDRVIQNLKLFNEAKQLRAKEMCDVIKENKGVPPLDLEEQVEERVAPKIDVIAERFKGGATPKEFETMPAPSSLPAGTRIQDDKTGQVFVSDGTRWTKEG